MHNLPIGVEPQTLVIPFFFDGERNVLRVATDRSQGASANTVAPVLNVINDILNRYGEYHMQSGNFNFSTRLLFMYS